MLYFFSGIFKFLIFTKNYLYDGSYLITRRLPFPVISIGNLSMGGAGKTPLVDYLIKYLLKEKKKPAVLSRGYGRKSKGTQLLSKKVSKPAVFFGDEAFMLYSKYNISYVVGKNRWKSGRYLLNHKKADYFILDDAFQHRQLFRDLNIVLLDVSQTKDFYQLFPLGRLREGFSSLKRADIVLFTKVNLVSSKRLQQFKEDVENIFCLDNVLTCDLAYNLVQFVSDKGGEINTNKPVVLISGIANPSVFEKNILDKKFSVKKHFVYADHFIYTENEVNAILSYCLKFDISQVICTEKDWHKLKEFSQWEDFLFYASLEVEFLTNKDLFLNKVNIL